MGVILVVDDSIEIRQLVSFSLKAAGYKVAEAASGQEALDYISVSPPDLVILDVMMPGMTGFDVLRTLRENQDMGGIPVVFLTARTAVDDKVQGFESGAEDYLTKPFEPKELVLRVGLLLRKKAETERLRQESKTDGLTELANRRAINERISEELSESRRHRQALSILMFDIDHFKRINDTYGHPAGDELLKQMAALLKGSVREEDVVGRFGGEEFLALLPHTSALVALKMAERLRKRIADNPFDLGEVTVNITVSLGVAGMPEDDVSTPEELISLADKRLYVAKHLGRNRSIGADKKPAADAA